MVAATELTSADARRALNLHALSDGWKRQISEKLAAAGATGR